MEILKIKPAYKDYLWGGERLKKEYGKETDMSPLAESWELSVHPDGPSVIVGGEYDGKTLKEYLDENPTALGEANSTGELPILIKLIDAEDNLSIQVHPDNEMAKELENQNGKTEMWYVVDAKPDAKIIFGMKEDTQKSVVEKAIKENTVLDLLSVNDSKKGDVFFVEAGTIHAIGKGNLIAEIQQNSNVTYRLYDYNRKGKDGKTRELHIEKGLKASDTKAVKNHETPSLSDGTRLLASCEYFAVRELKLNGEFTFNTTKKSYCALLNVGGSSKIDGEDFSQGQCLFIPAADGQVKLEGNSTILITETL